MCPLCRQQFALHPVSPPRHPEAAGDPQSGQPVVQADRLVLQTQGSQITMNVQCTCPQCGTALSASAQGLRESEGSIVCGHCSAPFQVQYNSNMGVNHNVSTPELMQLYNLLASMGGHSATRPRLTPAQLSILPTRVVTEKPDLEVDEDDERRTCMICLCEKDIGETLRTLPCMHDFHKECVDEWLTQNGTTCPVCKLDVMTGIRDSQSERDETRDQPSP